MLGINSAIRIEPNPQDYEKGLRRLLEDFTAFIRAAGTTVAPYTTDALQRFKSYPREMQRKIYLDFATYVSAVANIVESGIPLEDTERSLWCLFKRHDLRPRPDLFSSIGREDFVTVYLPNHVQWYRSFNYFRVCSYSLGELICIPWHDLYEHQSGAHTEFFLKTADDIFSNQTRESVFPALGPEICQERFSSRRLITRLEPRIISPLTGSSKQNEALVASWKAEVLDGLTADAGMDHAARPLTSIQPI